MNIISDLFARSPIGPIQQHIDSALQCVTLLGEFLEASFDGDWDKAAEIQGRLHETENEADDLKTELRSSLPNRLLLPVGRADLLALLSMQDRIANKAKDVSGIMLGRRMVIPEALRATTMECFKLSENSAIKAREAIQELDELLESGFKGREIDVVKSLTLDIHDLETQSDACQIKLRAELFAIEDSLNPVDVMFIYKVIGWLGNIADNSNKVGNRLMTMITR